MNLIKLVLSITQLPVTKYCNVFKGTEKLEMECEICLKDNIITTEHPPRKVPLALKQKLKDKLEQLKCLDIIEKVSEPTDWANGRNLVV
ncbi:hypothetical protein QYM36_003599 [Artemia franciscana]|uniref:Uncharacterized protein n=1 Tax=Artemia franciscana TaxID=6661 RepID=A0AA88I402_ARTSF|nr:hypothetical protein QYM36_003599 [Artemia franciscana]